MLYAFLVLLDDICMCDASFYLGNKIWLRLYQGHLGMLFHRAYKERIVVSNVKLSVEIPSSSLRLMK